MKETPCSKSNNSLIVLRLASLSILEYAQASEEEDKTQSMQKTHEEEQTPSLSPQNPPRSIVETQTQYRSVYLQTITPFPRLVLPNLASAPPDLMFATSCLPAASLKIWQLPELLPTTRARLAWTGLPRPPNLDWMVTLEPTAISACTAVSEASSENWTRTVLAWK
jgi:hypothetical protein